MNLVRFHNPHYNVNKGLVDELFNGFLRNDYHENYLQNCRNNPATNILETEKDFRIELLLPGFSKDDVQMKFHINVLTIKVDKEEEKGKNEDKYKYAHLEFGASNFEKNFKIPNSVNTEEIKAKFDNGVLNITLPKKEEALEKAPVDIKIG